MLNKQDGATEEQEKGNENAEREPEQKRQDASSPSLSNAYIDLIKRMEKMKKREEIKSAAGMDVGEIDEVIDDIEKEKSDREFEENFNRERIKAAIKLG